MMHRLSVDTAKEHFWSLIRAFIVNAGSSGFHTVEGLYPSFFFLMLFGVSIEGLCSNTAMLLPELPEAFPVWQAVE